MQWAMNTADSWEVSKEDIEGKVLFSVPYLGYAVNFAKTTKGFLLLIILPAVLIILGELMEIKREIEKGYKKKLENALSRHSESAEGGTKNPLGSFTRPDKVGRVRDDENSAQDDKKSVTKKKPVVKKPAKKTSSAAASIKTALLLVILNLFSLSLAADASLALYSDTETSEGNTITVGTWDTAETSVVLNEFLPDPIGDDNAPRDGGEWVELFNNSSEEEFDLAGWYVYDSDDGHELEITSTNSASYDENGDLIDDTATTIAPKGFLVVYRNGDGDFALNNDGGDEVRLYNGEMGESDVYEVDASNSHRDTNPDSDGNSNRNADTYSNRNCNSDTNTNGDANGDTDRNADSYGYANEYVSKRSHGYANAANFH